MKRFLLSLTGLLFAVNYSYASFTTNMEIQNIRINGGRIYVAIYFNEKSYINKIPEISFHFDPIKTIISKPLTLPNGEYLIAILQDTNGNGHMDYNFLGIPKEPYGFTNMKGKIPGNFQEMKVNITSSTGKLVIPLVEL